MGGGVTANVTHDLRFKPKLSFHRVVGQIKADLAGTCN